MFILSVGIIGCSSEKNEKPAESDQSAKNKENEGSIEDSNKENTEKDESTEAGGTETGSKPPENSSKGKPQDQENLKLGDTGVIQSTLGTAEITLKSIRKEADVKGTGSQLSHFLIADVEVKNIGEKDIKAKDWVDLLEMVWDMDGDGSENQSDYYDVQAIDTDLAPGESAKGEAIYDTEDTDEYYLMIDRGLLSGGSVYNNVKWSFKKSDL